MNLGFRGTRRSIGATRQAFTLVELVAVLFVLALLACVLLPVLAASGDTSRRTVCFNNLRQLGAACAMYPAENRDYMTLPNWGNVSAAPGWLYTLTNNVIPDPGPGGAYETNLLAAYSTGLWFQYVRDPRAYLCPVDIQSSSYAPKGNRAQRLSSYIMDGAVCGFGSYLPRSYKITDVWNPACWLIWGPDEAGLGGLAFNDGSSFPDEGPIEQLHTLGGGQVLAVAGSVQFVSTHKFKKELGLTVKNLAWWSPATENGR